MAIYDYECGECGIVFEKMLKIADRNNPLSDPCPECGKHSITKKVSVVAFGDPVKLGIRKLDSGMNEVLRGIKNANPGSTINDRGN